MCNGSADEAFKIAQVLADAVWGTRDGIVVGQVQVVGAMRVRRVLLRFEIGGMGRIGIQSGRRSVGSMVPFI